MIRLRERIAAKAAEIEATVGDGTPFFDAMDSWLCQPHWYICQSTRFHESDPDRNTRIVVSGEWGRGFAAWAPDDSILILPGGLRHNNLAPIEEDLRNLTYVFLDNSCYKGRTRGKIKARIEEAGGVFGPTFVIYDGSITPINYTYGLYRYHPPYIF